MKDFEIRCDESRLEKNNTLYGKFTLGPFLPGQGTTFGNALRRSLLSELPGLGITAFEILGIMQEFSTIPGLRESVLDLSLNFKKIVLTGILPCSIPPIGFLKVRGPALIKASDLQLPSGVYCVSPDQYIATLAFNGMLHVKFLVSVGKGYSTQPYSLYRSLSKVKLLPTLSTNLANSEIQNDVHTESRESSYFFEQRTGENSPIQSLFDETKELEKMSKIGIDNPPLKTQFVSPRYSESISQTEFHAQLGEDKEKNPKFSPSYLENEKGTSFNSLTPKELSKVAIEDQGQGYTTIQKQIFQRVNPHQVLPIDAVFTPVTQVNFLIQMNDRFETMREDIVLEIWTNGSIHPKRALEEATLSLVQNFDKLLKNIQQSSSFYKGLRYWKYFQPVEFDEQQTQDKELLGEDYGNKYSPLFTENDKKSYFTSKGGRKKNFSSNLLRKSYEKKISEDLTDPRFPLQRAIDNLDIGNLDLSLETFILLKQAKINTLSHLLSNLSFKETKVLLGKEFLNENTANELKTVINKFAINF